MKRYVLAAVTAAAAAFAATPASAQLVTYNTNGSTLQCGTAANCSAITGNSIRFGTGVNSLVLSYDPILSATVSAPSNISLGAIDSSNLLASNYDITGVLLNILLFSTPPGSSGSLPQGSISGTLAGFSSNATLSFLSGGVTIGGFNYAVTNSPLSINPPSSNAGVTTIQGRVTAVPEPATWAMMLLGFGGIGFAMRRRRQPTLAQVA